MMIKRLRFGIIVVSLTLVSRCLLNMVDAFSNVPFGVPERKGWLLTCKNKSRLRMTNGGFFDRIGEFFDDVNKKMGNADSNDGEASNRNVAASIEDGNLEVVERQLDEYLGSSLIFHIGAASMKLGGLRLLIFLLMMGELNDPEARTWKANQKDDNTLEMYFNDATGAIIVKFEEDVGVSVYRFGSSPSIQYMSQESRILQLILDEMETIAHGGDTKSDDRLLVLKNENSISAAREALSFA